MNLALWAAAATGAQVGAAIVASRFAVAEVPPLTLALMRYAIGFGCLAPFAAREFRFFWPVASMKRSFTAIYSGVGKDLLVMALLGIGQFALLIVLLNLGLQHIGAARAALIFSLFPLLTLGLSAALGREPVTPALAGGVVLSLGGVALSLAPRLLAASGGGATHWWGEAAVLASAAVGAVCSVAYRPYLRRYPTLPVSALAMGASVLVLAVLALAEHWPARVLTLSPSAWAAVCFIGLSSGAGYFAWLYALKHESPTRVTVFLALNPVTAAGLGWALLGEPVDRWALAATMAIGAGLWLATRTPARVSG